MSETQAVIFKLDHNWTPSKARAWLREHSLRPIKAVHRTEQSLRYRINDPKQYNSFSTNQLGKGVSLVIGYK